MRNIPTILLLKKLSTRRAPLVMKKEDGCNKFENLLSLDFLRECGTQKRSKKRDTWHFHRKAKAGSYTTLFHLARINWLSLAKDVKLSARWEAP